MKDFYSKELDRTFKEVLFLDGLEGGSPATMDMMSESTQGSKLNVEKLSTSVEPVEGSVSIGDIFADPAKLTASLLIRDFKMTGSYGMSWLPVRSARSPRTIGAIWANCLDES